MKLRICTFNIRCDTASDGINSFDGRKGLLLREFPKYGADIIGFQEVRPHVFDWLEENLEGYSLLGIGRDRDLGGEHTAIAFRRSLFKLAVLDTFWLSDTPRIPGSRFATDQSGCPRICTEAVLVTRSTHQPLRVYNTHLDHVGKMAQAQGISLILSRIAEDDARYPGVPVVLTGDFNVRPDTPVTKSVEAFVSCGKPLVDVTAEVSGTFHGYKPTEREMLPKIDYIYTNASCDISRTRVLTDSENGVYFSDHYPVLCEVDL